MFARKFGSEEINGQINLAKRGDGCGLSFSGLAVRAF
jgi:hypothetical protein